MANYIFQDLKTNAPNCKLEERLLQGTTNRVFAFTLFDRGKQALLDPSAKITVVALYNPRMLNGNFVYDGSFALGPTDPGYNVTVRETQIDDKFSIIYVPFRDEYVSYAGKCEFILKIEEGSVNTYTYSMEYNVDRNDAYFNNSIPNNLPSFSLLQKQIADMQLNKANKTLDNVDNAVFKAKAASSGIGKAETAAQIKAIIESASDVDKLDYKKALTGKPTGADIARTLEGVVDADKMAYTAIKDMVNPATIANKDLSNISNSDFEKKGKSSNFAQNDLEDVDLDKLSDKVFDSDAGKVIKANSTGLASKAEDDLSNVANADILFRGTSSGLLDSVKIGQNHGDYRIGDVKEIYTHDGLDLTFDTPNNSVSISLSPTLAHTNMDNITADTLSEAMKKTNAYQDILSKAGTHPTISGVTLDEVKEMFENEFFEETSPADLSRTPFDALTLYIQYQMTSTGQTLYQTLPPVSQNKVVMISKIDSTSVTNTTLTISPMAGELIDGLSKSISIGADKSGYVGYFLPIKNTNGWEFIPHEVSHDFSIAISDDKNNSFVGTNSIRFNKATVAENGGVLEVTPDPGSGGGGITGINLIDGTGATTTDVSILTIPKGTVTGAGAGKATLDFNADVTFIDDQKREFTGKKIQSLDGKIRISNMGNGLVDLDANYDNSPDGIFAKLGYPEDVNTDFHNQRLYYSDMYDKSGRYIGIALNEKAFTIQEGDFLDPNVSGGTNFDIGMYFEPIDGSIASDDGYLEIKVVDATSGDYLIDSMGLPVAIRREYKQYDVLKEEILLASVNAKGQRKIAFEIDASFGSQVVRASENTCVYIQATDKEHSTGIAEMLFQLHTGYLIQKNHRYYGYNFMNLAAALVKDKPEVELNNETELMGNGLFIDSRTKCKASINGYALVMSDNNRDLPVFYVGKLFDEIDTYNLRLKNLNTTVKIEDKNNAFVYALMKWTGQGKATLPIITGYTNGSPVYANGWVEVAQKFISEDPISGIHTDTNAFTVPADAVQCAMIIYPLVSQIPTSMILKDFEIDVMPAFTTTYFSNNSHISEFHLENLTYIYRSIVTLPSGTVSYRYSIGNTDTKLPVGMFSGGDGKIVNDNSWSDAGSYDPNKTQGDIKFLADGIVTVDYECQLFNETKSINQVELWLAKVGQGGVLTEVGDSRYATMIEADRTTPKIIDSKKFSFPVRTNETYRFFGKSDVADGFYLMTTNKANPLIRFNYSFDELTDSDQKVLDLIDKGNEVKFVDKGVEVFNKILQYDVSTGKMTVVDK